MRASHLTREKAAPFGGCLAGDPLRGDLIRRFAPPSPCAGKALDVEGVGPYYEEGVYEINMASPKEKKRYRSCTATS